MVTVTSVVDGNSKGTRMHFSGAAVSSMQPASDPERSNQQRRAVYRPGAAQYRSEQELVEQWPFT
jgi:hypothetical protein